MAVVNMGISMGIPMSMGWDEYGDRDQSPWPHWESMNIFNRCEIQ